jgi:hypothetical protein
MASIIRIKRSSVSGNPATLGAGELAYSALTDNGSNGGDRLYIGMGTETSGNAAQHYVVGGKYFMDLLDHTLGTLTASSAILVDSNSKINNINVGNITITGSTNTVSSTDTNGNIVLTPNGTGKLVLNNPYINGTTDTLAEYIYDTVGGAVTQGNGITVTPSDGSNTTTISIDTAVTVDKNTAQTLTNKTLTLPVFGGTGVVFNGSTSGTTTVLATAVAGTTTLTLPAATDTLVGKATTDTLTNKTINLANNTFTTTSAQLATAISDETGTGVVVFSNTPTLVTPVLGVATATSINKVAFTAPATGSTLTIADGKTLTASNTLTFTGTDASSVAFSAGGTVAYVANKLSVFAATSSAELAGVISDETGTGALVFSNTPTLVTPVLGAATATSITATSGNMVINAAAGNNNVNLVPTGTGTVDVGSKRITSLAEPTADSDAATKYYVDAARSGLDIKNSVKVATTANITLSNTQTIDGVALSVGDRVLVKDQSSAVQNGIYLVASGSWTRTTDADQPAELNPGTFVFVEQGTVNSDTGFVVTSDSVLTIGTDAINWTLFSTSGTLIAGAGLSKNGYTLEVNVANGIEVSSDNVQLASTVAGAGLTYTAGVLDVVGTSNRITVNANSIDIASTYVGQSSITTIGTIGTGVWQGTIIDPTYGGTGVNNGAKTITLGGNFATSGAYAATLTLTAGTNVTLPTTGTLATLAGTETFSNKTFSNTTNFSSNVTGAGAATSTLDGFNIDGGTY